MLKTLVAGPVVAAFAALAACNSVFANKDDDADADYAAADTTASSTTSSATINDDNPMVGGAKMDELRNIVENASNSADHTTLVSAVKAADLVETLSGTGPFTVFAPTNAAFDALPAGVVDNLLKPANKTKLTRTLTAHVVAGDLEAHDLMEQASAAGGRATLTTVSGDTLTFTTRDGKAYLTDESGGEAEIVIADVDQSNGVLHVVNGVLVPK